MDLRLISANALTHSPLFVGLLSLLLLALGLNSSRLRVKLGIYRGDGGNPAMAAAERAHGNTLEHAVPLMILLVLLELSGVAKGTIVALGTVAVLVRVLRAGGMRMRVRPIGMTGVVGTYLLEGLMATWLVIRSLERMG